MNGNEKNEFEMNEQFNEHEVNGHGGEDPKEGRGTFLRRHAGHFMEEAVRAEHGRRRAADARDGEAPGGHPGGRGRRPHGARHGKPDSRDRHRIYDFAEIDDLGLLISACSHLVRHPAGSAPGQDRVLQMIHAAGGRMDQKELQENLRVQPGSLSELLGKLEARGFLVREKNEEDRRKASVVLTDKGKAAASSSEKPDAADGGDPRFAALTAEEQETLRGLLRKLLAKK